MHPAATRVTPARKAAFLELLARTGSVRASARGSGIDKATAYRLRKKWPDFAHDWDEALKRACDGIEAAARQRAAAGWDRPPATARQGADAPPSSPRAIVPPEAYVRTAAGRGRVPLPAPADLAERMIRGRQRVDAWRKQAGLPPIDWDGPL